MKSTFYSFSALILILFCVNTAFGQSKIKKSKPSQPVKKATSSYSSLSQSAVSLSNARLDACMQKNRKITDDMFILNSKLTEVSNELGNITNNSTFYKTQLERSRDSVRTVQLYYKQVEDEAKSQLSIMSDSLAILRDFREKMMIEKQGIANDPNVLRVYDFPADIVRIKMLRKFLDEGAGIVLEKNTDDGFSISKVFKDRIRKVGIGKKEVESKVDCSIKMAPHPFNSDRTMFYAVTTTKERIGKKPFEDVADKALSKEYEQKLLKFFDTFLTK